MVFILPSWRNCQYRLIHPFERSSLKLYYCSQSQELIQKQTPLYYRSSSLVEVRCDIVPKDFCRAIVKICKTCAIWEKNCCPVIFPPTLQILVVPSSPSTEPDIPRGGGRRLHLLLIKARLRLSRKLLFY